MSLIHSIADLAKINSPTVVSIGNFDGVHLGHQFVVKQLLKQAKNLGLPSVIITFDPLAKEYFSRKSSGKELPARLSLIEHRAELLHSHGVDYVLCLSFDSELENQSAQDFVDTVLIEALKVRYLVVGDDFRFGYKRQGDFNFLRELGESNGFSVASMQTFLIDDQRVSSGRVRVALAQNDFIYAKQLLGRDYSIKGRVSRGQQLGRKLGFPTANIALPDVRLPFEGVYLVKVFVPNEGVNGLQEYEAETVKRVWGVANIGARPTVDGAVNRLEVHLLELNDENTRKSNPNKSRQAQDSGANYALYGLNIEVFFVSRIRFEKKFDSVALLQQQIGKDIENALKLISKTS